MAVTLAIVKRLTGRQHSEVIVDVTGPAAYTSPGGELLTAAQQAQLMPALGSAQPLDLTKIEEFESEVEPASFRFLVLDRANSKIKFVAGSTEVANAVNLSAVTIRARLVYGIRGS